MKPISVAIVFDCWSSDPFEVHAVFVDKATAEAYVSNCQKAEAEDDYASSRHSYLVTEYPIRYIADL